MQCRWFLLTLLLITLSTACVDGTAGDAGEDAPALGEVEAELQDDCGVGELDCDGGEECADLCTTASACNTRCDILGVPKTCGQYGTCQACSTCTSSDPCADTCKQGGLIKTCGSVGVCQSCSYSTCASAISCHTDCRDTSVGGALVDCNEWGSNQDVYGPDRGDWDLDRIDDDLEHELARRFYPELSMTYYGVNGCFSDRHLYYGHGNTLPLPRTTVPYVVNRKVGASAACPYGECIEIIYGLPFSWDAGDVQNLGYTEVGIREHRGDSEMYAVLLAHRPQDGTTSWGTTSTTTARSSATVWRAIKHFTSAHMCEGSYLGSSPDSSDFLSEGTSGRSTPRTLWVAEGKHALYFSAGLCDGGGWLNSDNCNNSITINRTPGVGVLTNAGARTCNEGFTTSIAKPASACNTEPSGSESVWSGSSFGASSPWTQKLNSTVLRWRDETYTCY